MSAKRSTRSLAAVVLAAGKGKRLKSGLPKVLHHVAGRPLLWHALQNALAAKPDRIVIVVSNGAEQVEAAVRSWSLSPEPVFVRQEEPLGTGHAVAAAEKAVGKVAEVLVVAGDFDPVTPPDVRRLMKTHRRTGSAASILTADIDVPGGLARVVREGTRLLDIVEGTDAPAELLAGNEVSALVFAFRRDDLYKVLPLVGRENRQNEYYLNAVFPILIEKGERVSAVKVDTGGMMGPNSRADLARLGALLRRRVNENHMVNGVTIVDPDTTHIEAGVLIGRDTVIHPMTFLSGDTRIGRGCSIGPSVQIRDSEVGDDVEVRFAVIEGAQLARGVDVGPFARIRPGTVLDENVHVGSYIEVKNSRVGRGSKIPHLSYVGDAEIGRGTNIGAATVTVNYDGYAKHGTVIGDEVRIGSDTMLVAPVRVGDRATTGAGSVITKDVPAGSLAIERAEQRIVEGYRDRKDAEQAAKAQARPEAKAKGQGKGKGSRKGAR